MQEDKEVNHGIIVHLQTAYLSMISELEQIQEEKRAIILDRDSSLVMISEKLNQNTVFYETLLQDKTKRINELEDHIKRLEIEQSEKSQRQSRKFIESINEKEAECNNLKKQLNNMKSKISSLQLEIGNICSIKEDLELFIVKGIQQLRNFNKEMNSSIDETDTQKMVMESKYKQTNQKISMLSQKINQLDMKFKSSEQNYGKMKTLFKQSKDQCIEQKFQIEQLKQQLRNNAMIAGNQNHQGQDIDYLAYEMQNIVQLSNILREREKFLHQVANYHQMNCNLITQNEQLKKKMYETQYELHELKSKILPGYQDDILKKNDLSLFEYLEQKKASFNAFEEILEKIQSYIEEKDEKINNAITNFSKKSTTCFCGKQEQIAKLHIQFSKVQSEIQKYESSSLRLQTSLEKAESQLQKNRSKINILQSSLSRVNEQLSKSQSNLARLKAQLTSKQAELDQISKKNDHFQETNFKIKKQTSFFEKKIERYKMQIKQLFSSDGKIKKKKGTMKKRCLNCFLCIERGQSGQGCSDCKRIYHVECINQHNCEIYKLDDGLSYMSGTQS